MSLTITSAEVSAAISLAQSTGFSNALAAFKAAIAEHFADANQDAIVVEDALSLAAQIPGLSELSNLSTLIKVAMVINAAATPYPNGGVFGAFEDSINGVVRPVPTGD
jgi:hypothetical protein